MSMSRNNSLRLERHGLRETLAEIEVLLENGCIIEVKPRGTEEDPRFLITSKKED